MRSRTLMATSCDMDSHCLETKLRLGLNKPRLNVITPEPGFLHSDIVEKVGGEESRGNSLKDSCISS